MSLDDKTCSTCQGLTLPQIQFNFTKTPGLDAPYTLVFRVGYNQTFVPFTVGNITAIPEPDNKDVVTGYVTVPEFLQGQIFTNVFVSDLLYRPQLRPFCVLICCARFIVWDYSRSIYGCERRGRRIWFQRYLQLDCPKRLLNVKLPHVLWGYDEPVLPWWSMIYLYYETA